MQSKLAKGATFIFHTTSKHKVHPTANTGFDMQTGMVIAKESMYCNSQPFGIIPSMPKTCGWVSNQALHPIVAPEDVEIGIESPKANVTQKGVIHQLLRDSHWPWVVLRGVAIIPARAAAAQASAMMCLASKTIKVQLQASKSNSPTLKPNIGQPTTGEC